jgi:hypothetical protein
MNFWRVSLAIETSFFTSTSFSKISSTTCVVNVVSFSSLYFSPFFIMPCTTANAPMTLSDSSCRGTNHYAILFFFSLNFSIWLYDYLFSRMDVLCAQMVAVYLYKSWPSSHSPMHSLIFPRWPSSLDPPSTFSKVLFFLRIISCTPHLDS